MSTSPLHRVAPELDPIRELTSARVTHAVSPETARVLLHLEPVGRLVLQDAAGHPVVLPVNHRMERDGSLLMRTAAGAKLRAARTSAEQVAFEVDRLDEHGRGWVVVATGPLEEVLDLTEQAGHDQVPGGEPFADDVRRDRWLRLEPRVLSGYRLGSAEPDVEDPTTLRRASAAAGPPPRDRGELEILGIEDCYWYLRSAPVGRIAYVDAGEPLVLPVNHGVDGRRIVFRSAAGSKAEAADRARRVAFEVDGYDVETRTGWSVLVRGVLDVVWDEDEEARLRTVIPEPWADGIERDRILVLNPTQVSGRRITRDTGARP